MTAVLSAARAATRHAHDRLEVDLDVLARARSPEQYGALLAGFRTVYAPVEDALAADAGLRAAVPDWRARRKTAWLDTDLATLRGDSSSLRSGRDVLPALSVTLPSTAHLLGALYVMEGATLGGAVLARELSARAPTPPHRFFRGYGPRRGAMWQAFRRHVESSTVATRHVEDVVDGAVRTFDALGTACGVPR